MCGSYLVINDSLDTRGYLVQWSMVNIELRLNMGKQYSVLIMDNANINKLEMIDNNVEYD